MKSDRVYLQQILDAADKIRAFTHGMDHDGFLKDEKTQSAVIMQLALIGEVAKRISEPTKANIAVPWRAITGFRDRAIHDYYQIDLMVAWETVLHDLDPLSQAVKTYLDT